MNLSAPKQLTFWIAVVVAVVAVISYLVTIPVLSGLAFWILVAAFVILGLGVLIEGL